jgi:hypothetical protein
MRKPNDRNRKQRTRRRRTREGKRSNAHARQEAARKPTRSTAKSSAAGASARRNKTSASSAPRSKGGARKSAKASKRVKVGGSKVTRPATVPVIASTGQQTCPSASARQGEYIPASANVGRKRNVQVFAEKAIHIGDHNHGQIVIEPRNDFSRSLKIGLRFGFGLGLGLGIGFAALLALFVIAAPASGPVMACAVGAAVALA